MKTGIQRVVITKKQWMLLGIKRISCFVIPIIKITTYSKTCWQLHDRPTRGRGGSFGGVTWRRGNRSSIFDQTPIPSSSTPNRRTLSKEEPETLHQLMSQLEPPTIASSFNI